MGKKIVPFLVLALFIGCCSLVAKTPEPKWQTLQKDGPVEIRHYDSMIIAETVVTGERYTAINDGFRILAGYIFGGNTSQKKISQRNISMTAPVLQQSSNGEKITMTAPVLQQSTEQPDEWKVRFVMPPEYTLASLPKPDDNRIKFIAIPAYRAAIIRFAGFNTNTNLKQHQDILVHWLEKEKIKSIGEPLFAFYNPPWTLPFMRRNEVMIQID
jgi:hypothetical protein